MCAAECTESCVQQIARRELCVADNTKRASCDKYDKESWVEHIHEEGWDEESCVEQKIRREYTLCTFSFYISK